MTMPAFDAREFRKALGAFMTGVTVVTTRQADGEPRGFTANSFTSVSLDPPLVLVCIARSAASFPIFAAAESFAVSVLAEDQRDISGLFASKAPDKFARAAWREGATGSPLIAGAAAWFDCRTANLVDAGDHLILIGEVADFAQSSAGPLGYCRGAYVTAQLSQDALATAGHRTRVGAILERDGALLLLDGADGKLDLPTGISLEPESDPQSLRGKLRQLGLAARLGFLFAVFEDKRGEAGAMQVYYRGTIEGELPQAAALHLVPFADISWTRLRDEAVRTMLRRYVKERSEDAFGIYVGDAEQGSVQPLARPV